MDARAGGEVQAADPRRLRSAGQPLARNRAPVGRRDHRPRSDSRRSRPSLRRNAECADTAASAVWRFQDVMMLRQRFIGLSTWLIIAGVTGSLGQLIFGAGFWVVAGFTLIGLFGNALVIEWEDKRRGGWGK